MSPVDVEMMDAEVKLQVAEAYLLLTAHRLPLTTYCKWWRPTFYNYLPIITYYTTHQAELQVAETYLLVTPRRLPCAT